MTTVDARPVLELDDIQAATLRPRPSPYAGAYVLVRIDDRRDGRELLRRALPAITTAADRVDPTAQATVRGRAHLLRPAGPRRAAGFARQLPRRVPAGHGRPCRRARGPRRLRARTLGAAVGIDATSMSPLRHSLPTPIAATRCWPRPGRRLPTWRVSRRSGARTCYAHCNERTSFGFKDGINHPAIDGSGVPGTDPGERPLASGEFVLGHVDESGERAADAHPDVLGRNGTYLVFRKLHTRVADFRRYVRSRAKDAADEELLAAKFVGRWPSGAPLDLTPDRDDPELGADPRRNNAFRYTGDDRGLRCPLGAHARRMNARDAVVIGEVRLHRMVRRSASYGPMLPPDVLDDDGADRGIVFACLGTHLARQFEFVKTHGSTTARSSAPPKSATRSWPGTPTASIHRAPRADPQTAHRVARLRGDPRRRVLLPTQSERAALDRRPRHLRERRACTATTWP